MEVLRASRRACASGRPQDVHVRVAPRQHAPGGLGVDDGGLQRGIAPERDPLPQLAKGAQLGDSDELISVYRHGEGDRVEGIRQRDPIRLQRPQIQHALRQRRGQFLPLAGACLVVWPEVDGEERPGEAARQQCGDGLAQPRRHTRPVPWHSPQRREACDRIEAEVDRHLRRIELAPLHQRRNHQCIEPARRGGIEAQPDQIDMHARQRRVEISDGVAGEAVAPRGAAAGEHQRQRIRPALEVLAGLRGGSVGIGMIDPRRHAPAACGIGARHQSRVTARRMQRLDGDAVMGAGDQLLLEVRALQNRIDADAPVGFGNPGESIGEGRNRVIHER
jgi:hypothetical protein